MQTLREFFTSSSGLAPVRQGLGLGGVISALTGIAVLLGAREAAADDCEGTSWTTDPEPSAGCAAATDGALSSKCRDCWLDSNCEKQCGSFYCCA